MANPLFYEGMTVPSVKPVRLGKAVITIANGANLVCQNAQYQYGRPVTYVHPLNLDKVLLVAGMPQGTLFLEYVVGPSEGLVKFLESYSDACELNNNSIILSAADGCSGDTAKNSFELSGLIIASLGGTVSRTQGGNMMLQSVTMNFTSLTPK
jgi:hypothetical protein